MKITKWRIILRLVTIKYAVQNIRKSDNYWIDKNKNKMIKVQLESAIIK